MAETASTMLALGTLAPAFELLDPRSGEKRSLEQLKSKQATVIMFICNHCPYVKLILPQLVSFSKAYGAKGVNFVAINSNDVEKYPADGPEHMKALAESLDFSFPYLLDDSQVVAKAYQAACTPDFYAFDKDLKCVYRGRFDEATPGNGKAVSGDDLGLALDQLLSGQAVSSDQKASLGCNIKWKK